MKRIVILGAGTGGTMVGARLREKLEDSEWEITLIDSDELHYYQPGFAFLAFGIYKGRECIKYKRDLIPKGVNFILDNVVAVDSVNRKVEGEKDYYSYDWLIIATGCQIAPEEIEGIMPDWYGNVYDFYTYQGATKLAKRLENFESGRVVVCISEYPFKCPIAPIEFALMADWFFTSKGIRGKIELEFVTPLSGVFTKPEASKILGALTVERNIKVTPDFCLAHVNTQEKFMGCYRGTKIPYDLLVVIPPNVGAPFIENSGLGDPMGYVYTDNFTLKAESCDRTYVIGDVANIPTSKAGSTAHYEVDIVVKNIINEIEGSEPESRFDGHATCFIASGFRKAILVDFDYDAEPRLGKFPFSTLGPFSSLKETSLNYWGKIAFKWLYWNQVLKGKGLPLFYSQGYRRLKELKKDFVVRRNGQQRGT